MNPSVNSEERLTQIQTHVPRPTLRIVIINQATRPLRLGGLSSSSPASFTPLQPRVDTHPNATADSADSAECLTASIG